MFAIKNQHLTYKSLKDLPRGVRQCRRCLVLIGRGHQQPAKSDPRICHWCENETSNQKEHKMSENRSLGITEERVAKWAEWRRNGKSYSFISEQDDLGPSYPTIKAHLEKNGYTPDGDLAEGEAPVAPVTNLPDGWGKVETEVLPPNKATGKYVQLIKHIRSIISTKWARMEAPGTGASTYFADQLRKQIPGVETANRKIGGKQYFYFRLKKDK